jgi:hypothetical protein
MDHPAERQAMPQKPSNSRPADNSEVTIRRQNRPSLTQVNPTCRLRIKLNHTDWYYGRSVHIKGRAGLDSQGGVIR